MSPVPGLDWDSGNDGWWWVRGVLSLAPPYCFFFSVGRTSFVEPQDHAWRYVCKMLVMHCVEIRLDEKFRDEMSVLELACQGDVRWRWRSPICEAEPLLTVTSSGLVISCSLLSG
jgi:hypothetical protein